VNAVIPAVILAGGRSTRMGGGDKALLPLVGRPMLAHVIERLKPQAGPMAINANGDPVRFDAFGLPVIRDTVSGFAGPLAGILAGMEWASQVTDDDLVLSVAGDTPFFPNNLGETLRAASAGSGIALASSAGRTHPVFGLWPLSLRDHLVRFLAEHETLKVMAFAEACGFATADFPLARAAGRAVDPFFNINTPDDLAAAEAICKEWGR
jgi:molybdenum cofactor guanylyltransferase